MLLIPILNSRMSLGRKSTTFLDLDVALYNRRLESTAHVKPTDICTTHPHIQSIQKKLLYLAKLYVSVQFVLVKRTIEIITSKWDHGLWRGSTLKNSLIMKWRKLDFFPANLPSKKRENRVPFVVTYHHILKGLSKIIRDNTYLLNMNEKVKKTFTPRPMISFRSARKLSSYLVRTKLYPLQRKVGSSKCGKRRWEVCNNVTDFSILVAQWLEILLRLTIVWTVTISVLSILWPPNSVTNNTRVVKLQISFVIDGITIKAMLESLTGKSFVCRNTYLNIFRLRVTKAF